MSAFHVFFAFVILAATLGFIIFMEERVAETKSNSQREILKRTRHILDRLLFELAMR